MPKGNMTESSSMFGGKNIIMIVLLVAVLVLSVISLFTSNKTVVQSSVETQNMVGTVIAWKPLNGETNPPAGWAVCDGSTISFTDVSGATKTYILPDLRGRFIVGVNQGGSWNNKNIVGATLSTDNSANSPNYNDTIPLTNYEVDNKGGEEEHKLTVEEIPPLETGITDGGRADIVQYPAGNAANLGVGISSFAGGDGSFTFSHQRSYGTNVSGQTHKGGGPNLGHNTLPPYYALVYIIKIY